MNKMQFESSLRQKEEAFIRFKKDFGHPYTSQTYYLLDFDRFCLAKYPNAKTLTEEMAMEWSIIKSSETSKGYISRITALRQFGKYLVMMGENAFVIPNGLKGGNMPLMPYVFTQESLKSFFSYVDTMDKYYQSPARHIVAPIMFRYMYCCGLRPAETRRLEREDINLETGRVFIRESKNNQERIVYVQNDLLLLTREYLQEISSIFPSSPSLFVDRNGDSLSPGTHQYLFDVCRRGSGITASGTKQPNLYSFRHSFATHRIYQWHKEGKDINTLIPILSSFMGHSRFQDTLYYLHFIPEIFSDMSGFDFEQFSKIVPEVICDE